MLSESYYFLLKEKAFSTKSLCEYIGRSKFNRRMLASISALELHVAGLSLKGWKSLNTWHM
ncbi:MAG: hypothetical protein WAR01_01365, partial [Dokdonella sp.]